MLSPPPIALRAATVHIHRMRPSAAGAFDRLRLGFGTALLAAAAVVACVVASSRRRARGPKIEPPRTESASTVEVALPSSAPTPAEASSPAEESSSVVQTVPLPRHIVPEDYRAAGVVFFTRAVESGAVSQVLLGVEERKVSRKDLGLGAGSVRLPVLVFPQGKRERCDQGFVDTARREFLEETGEDAAGLCERLAALAAEGPPVIWYAPAKMAVVFCEVPSDSAAVSGQCLPPQELALQSALPLRPVWVEAHELRRSLAAENADEVSTSIGRFALFPLAKRFLQTRTVAQWLHSPCVN